MKLNKIIVIIAILFVSISAMALKETGDQFPNSPTVDPKVTDATVKVVTGNPFEGGQPAVTVVAPAKIPSVQITPKEDPKTITEAVARIDQKLVNDLFMTPKSNNP
jgi:hypothetical protein